MKAFIILILTLAALQQNEAVIQNVIAENKFYSNADYVANKNLQLTAEPSDLSDISTFFISLLLDVLAPVTKAVNVAVEDFRNANNLFAVAAYTTLKNENQENFIFSPYSAETVLALAQAGCRGDTAKELRTALNLPNNDDLIKAGVKSSFPLIKGDGLYTLYAANKMYVKDNFPIRYGFHRSATAFFGADVESIDFLQRLEAIQTMNEWVASKTNNKISDLVDLSLLDKYTTALLLNALYFKARWSIPFDSNDTRKQRFYKSGKDVVRVLMMHQRNGFYNYAESSVLKAQFLEIPFEGGDVSMVIALPNEIEGLSTLESQIDRVLAPQDFSTTRVHIDLPRFKVESTIKLKDILKQLGVRRVFGDDEGSDLSGIAGEPGDLMLKEVVQKTFIDVEERGIEAAAADNVMGVRFSNSVPVHYGYAKEFVVDHPFIFYVKVKGFVIFTGRVLSPNL